jgi:methylmalonyl-CoA/ethylmalonyl-CoA epimerase
MTLHHVGIVVKDIDSMIPAYRDLLGMKVILTDVHDPIQKVHLCFLQAEDGHMVELIAPASEDSPVVEALAKGGGLNHLCYVVEDIEEKVKELRSKRFLVVCKPVAAVAFEGRRVAFLFHPKVGVLELVERDGPPSPLIAGS